LLVQPCTLVCAGTSLATGDQATARFNAHITNLIVINCCGKVIQYNSSKVCKTPLIQEQFENRGGNTI
jgi:RNase P subunit RPR2